jgi:hypothetical protein
MIASTDVWIRAFEQVQIQDLLQIVTVANLLVKRDNHSFGCYFTNCLANIAESGESRDWTEAALRVQSLLADWDSEPAE